MTPSNINKFAHIHPKLQTLFGYNKEFYDNERYLGGFIKFGVGRAMMDSAQEIRNGHIDKDEGLALIDKFDGEYPTKYESEFLDYISMSKDEFLETCDKFRPEHIWQKKSNRWEMIMSANKYFLV